MMTLFFEGCENISIWDLKPLFALLPMLCVFVLWFVMGPIEGHRIGNWPLAPPQA
jgi:hypothetical protein